MRQGITRVPYSDRSLSWIPGWQVTLTEGRPSQPVLLDALALQRRN